MKTKRFSVEQIVAGLKEAEAGMPVAELIRRIGISEHEGGERALKEDRRRTEPGQGDAG
jgi:hypothetical protein